MPKKKRGIGTILTGGAIVAPTPGGRQKLRAVVFDLDGVLVGTAKFHYLAWKSVADEEGIYFDEAINERLKGVSRLDSLKIILESGGREYPPEEMAAMAERKNERYAAMLDSLAPDDIFEGIVELLSEIHARRVKAAICSGSRNAAKIIDKLRIRGDFDVIVSGEDIVHSKPHPEGFLLAAERLGIVPYECAAVEDAFAGVQAAKAAGMKTVGIGDKAILHNADLCLSNTKSLNLRAIEKLF